MIPLTLVCVQAYNKNVANYTDNDKLWEIFHYYVFTLTLFVFFFNLYSRQKGME